MTEQQRLLHPFLFDRTGDMYRFAAEGVTAGVIDTGRQASRGGGEVLNLFNLEAMFFQLEGDLDHIFESATGVAADQVGHNRLAQSELLTASAELIQKIGKGPGSRFMHRIGHPVDSRFGGDLEQTTDMVLEQGIEVVRLKGEQVITYPRGDKDVFDLLLLADLGEELHHALVTGLQIFAGCRKEATVAPTDFFCPGVTTVQAVHIGGRSTDIAEGAAKFGVLGQALNLAEDGAFGTGLDGFALMVGDGAEGTAPETAAVTGD